MRFLFVLTFVFTFAAGGFAQGKGNATINSLKKQQKQSKEKIELTNKLLKETEKDKKNTVSSLSLLKKQISEREKLINSISTEINLLDSEQAKLDTQRTTLEIRLEKLKKEYANLIYHSYFFKKNYNSYLFILSAENFNQAFRRLRYLQQYAAYQKEQAVRIQKVTAELDSTKNQLLGIKTEKQSALHSKENENQKLQNSQQSKQKMLTDLSKKEKDLKKQLEDEKKKAVALNKQIDDLVAAEIAKEKQREKERLEKLAQEKAAKEAKKPSTTTATKPKTTSTATKPAASAPPANAKSSADIEFEKNKGRLPMPVKGIITGHFGVQKHHELGGLEVNNRGIYIQTEPNADACAIYGGEVTQVFAIPGNNNSVIVKHGNFRTVYNNLTTIYVKVGEKISSKQKLGKIYVDSENSNKTMLYFMLYNNSTLENPENWLIR